MGHCYHPFSEKEAVKWLMSLSHVQLFVTPWTVACQAPQSMGFFQARVVEWVAISFPRGSSWSRDRTWVFRTAGRPFTVWATGEVKGCWGTINILKTNNIPDSQLNTFHGLPRLSTNNSISGTITIISTWLMRKQAQRAELVQVPTEMRDWF